ncbi:hypothetical protein B0H67DRAFT_558478 [Lasiosphaeris hirsuta]|uniref:Uncharacterized protein n=1 Tax=Lasiosphaeris hirsuta TaxID=260670 RepID=A0AA39ZR95_9PEZI|nr:hypothetical protein B0H67DRAFT_558478 [Lasiosphaeris hirsuta]
MTFAAGLLLGIACIAVSDGFAAHCNTPTLWQEVSVLSLSVSLDRLLADFDMSPTRCWFSAVDLFTSERNSQIPFSRDAQNGTRDGAVTLAGAVLRRRRWCMSWQRRPPLVNNSPPSTRNVIPRRIRINNTTVLLPFKKATLVRVCPRRGGTSQAGWYMERHSEAQR